MRLDIEHWNVGYSQIQKDCQEQNRAVLLVVSAASVDAVCAARIWAYWLRADGISYELMAANHLRAVQERLSLSTQQQQPAEYGACVLLGLGATVNLTKALAGAPCTVYVSDGRRPVHLANLHSQDDIVVFWDNVHLAGTDGDEDGQGQEYEIPSDGDNLSGNESSTDEEDDDDDDDDEDEDDSDDSDDEGETEFMDDDVVGSVPEASSSNDKDKSDYDGEDEMDQDSDNDDDDDNDKNDPTEFSKSKRRRLSSDPAADEKDPVNQTMDTAMTEDTDMDTPASPSSPTNDNNDNDKNDDETQSQDNGSTQDEPTSQEKTQSTLPTLTPRDLHRQRREKLRQYYANGTIYGSPSSYIAWQVSKQTRHGQNADLLWLAMTGVTASFQLKELDLVGYSQLATSLDSSCSELFPDDAVTRVQQQVPVYAEHLIGNNNNNEDTARTKVMLSQNGRILAEHDFRFFLLRQTSLYQSIFHSDYIATKLQLTTPAGQLRLKEWLATMGFSLQDCSQPYGLMKPNLRRRLQQAVTETMEEYGLDALGCMGFFRVTGFQSLLSASDVAHAVAALLALTTTDAPSASNNNKANPNDAADEAMGEEQESADEQRRNDEMQQAFQAAYDALNYSNSGGGLSLEDGSNPNSMANLVEGTSAGKSASKTGITAGFRMALRMQENIMDMANTLMTQNAITRLTHFRYAFITMTASGGGLSRKQAATGNQKFHMFAQPMVLTKLAHYLMDWHRYAANDKNNNFTGGRRQQQWTGDKARPLILCAQDPRNDTYTVVGNEFPEDAGHIMPNKLGQYFALAAETLNHSSAMAVGANGDDDDENNGQEQQRRREEVVRLDYSFDSHVVQVASPYVQRFIEQLHYLMDSI